MCDTTNSMNPRERLASRIRIRTNDGDDILDYLCDVFYDREPGVLHGHRLQAGRLLVIYGQLGKDALERLHRLDPHSAPKADRDQANSDARLAKIIRRMTDDAEGVVDYLLDTMNGIDQKSKRRICHNTRLAAARELLKRGYPCECSAHTRPATAQAATEDSRADSADSAPMTEDLQPASDHSDNAEEDGNIEEVLAIVKQAIEDTDPSEYEEEKSDHKPDYSMWEIIRKKPRPVITEEHARIGAALFHEAMERQRLWEESDVKIPTRKDHNSYDDG